MKSKKCGVCKAVKSVEHFHKDRAASDGRQGRCKNCNNTVCAKYRAGHREKIAENVRKAKRKGIERVLDYNRKWIAENKLARLAHLEVYRAVKSGKLLRPDHCEVCGRQAERIEAHHDDYSQPLKVKWLCNICHGKLTYANN